MKEASNPLQARSRDSQTGPCVGVWTFGPVEFVNCVLFPWGCGSHSANLILEFPIVGGGPGADKLSRWVLGVPSSAVLLGQVKG